MIPIRFANHHVSANLHVPLRLCVSDSAPSSLIHFGFAILLVERTQNALEFPHGDPTDVS